MMNLPKDRDGSDHDEPQSLSLLSGVGGMGGGSAPTDAELLEGDGARAGNKLLGQGGMVIVVVALVAAGSIWAMRVTQSELAGAAASDVEAKIEAAIAKLSKPATIAPDDPLKKQNLDALFQDTGAIVDMFAMDLSEHQVPVEYVQKNPFQMSDAASVATAMPVVDAERERTRRLEDLKRELAKLSLQTVMVSGSREVAIINGDFYQPRQQVGSFTVQQIDQRGVTLVAGDETFRLDIEADDSKKGRR